MRHNLQHRNSHITFDMANIKTSHIVRGIFRYYKNDDLERRTLISLLELFPRPRRICLQYHMDHTVPAMMQFSSVKDFSEKTKTVDVAQVGIDRFQLKDLQASQGKCKTMGGTGCYSQGQAANFGTV